MGGAVRPGVGESGRGEDRGVKGGQDGGQDVQVLAGWLSNEGGVQTGHLWDGRTGVPTRRGGVQPTPGVTGGRWWRMLLLRLLGDGGRRGGGGGLVGERGLAGGQGAEPLPARLRRASHAVALQLLPGPAAHQRPRQVLPGRGLPPR